MTTFMRASNAFFKERQVKLGWRKTPLDRYVWRIYAVGTLAVFLGTLQALNWPNPKMLNLVVMLVAAVLSSINLVKFIRSFNTPLYAYRREVFATSKQAGFISVEAQKTLHTLGTIEANNGFDSAMYHLTALAKPSSKAAKTLVTPAGHTFGGVAHLPLDDAEAFKIVMRESLYAWLIQEEYLGPEDPNDIFNDNIITDISTRKIPLIAQEYIFQFFKDLILVNPLRFDKAILEQFKTGLGNVVDTLQALECSATEAVSRIKEWESTGTTLQPASSPTPLPDNLT